MNIITQILSWISDSLLVPVVVLLLALFVYALIMLGGFFSLYLRLLANHRQLRRIMANPGDFDPAKLETLPAGPFAAKLRRLAELKWHPIHCEKQIAEYHQRCLWELERPKFLIKVGPMLGLMGTLIPMGPALVGLANGDIAAMACNIQVAFTTTVVGIFIGAVGLVIFSVKNNWYREEISNLQYALDLQLHRRGE